VHLRPHNISAMTLAVQRAKVPRAAKVHRSTCVWVGWWRPLCFFFHAVTSYGDSRIYWRDRWRFAHPPNQPCVNKLIWHCSPARLTGLTLPSGITEIGEHAFQGCVRMACELQLPAELVEICSAAFERCRELTAVVPHPRHRTTCKLTTIGLVKQFLALARFSASLNRMFVLL
jgi:hypothetical protein